MTSCPLILIAPWNYMSDDRNNRRGYPAKDVSRASLSRRWINTVNRPSKARMIHGTAIFNSSLDASHRTPGRGQLAVPSAGSHIPAFLRPRFDIVSFRVHATRKSFADQFAMGDGRDGFGFVPAAVNDILTLPNFKGLTDTPAIYSESAEHSRHQRE